MSGVFISYSRRDKAFVARLQEALAGRGYDVWVDWQDIPPSAEWFEEIRAGIRAADGFAYVISPDSVASTVCARELEQAVEDGKRIVPVVHRDPDGADVPEAVAALNWIFLREGDDFDAGLEQVVTALEQDLEHVRMHTRLGVAASRWDAGGRDRAQLVRGAELAAAEAWLVSGSGKQPEATRLQREYVLASRQAATRRQRTVIGAVTLALLVSLALAAVAVVQRSHAIHERNVAFARQLEADARANFTRDPELSVLLAVRAADVDPGPTTEEALREALAQSHVRRRFLVSPGSAGDALWSPDGTRLLVTRPGRGGWARIYAAGDSARPVSLGLQPSSAGESGWDGRGERVIVGGGHVAVFDARTGKLVARLSGTGLFAALARDGSRAITVDVSSVGHVFELPSGRELATFRPSPRGDVTCFALSPDGRLVAQCETTSLTAVAARARLDLWDARTGRLVRSTPTPAELSSVTFSPDASRYAFTTAGDARRGTYVVDARSGRIEVTFAGAASVAAFGPDTKAQLLAYATSDEVGHVYSFRSKVNRPLIGATDAIEDLRFSEDGTEVVAAGKDGGARVYDASTGGQPIETLAGHSSRVTTASFGLGGTMLATTSDDGTIRLWTTLRPRPSVTRQQVPLVAGLSYAYDSSHIDVATQSGEGLVLAASDLHRLARFEAPAGGGFAGAAAARSSDVVVTLSGPVGKGGAISRTTAAEVFDGRSGRLIARVPGESLSYAAVTDAGDRLVALESAGPAAEWSAAGPPLRRLPGSSPGGAAAFSNEGGTIAVAHYPPHGNGHVTVDLWSAASGRRERTIRGEVLQSQVEGATLFAPLSVAFSADGSMVAVAGADPAVEVYDTASGRLVRRLPIVGNTSNGSFAASLAFSPDGKLLAAGGVSATYVWRVPSFAALPPFQQVPLNLPFVTGSIGVQVGFSADSSILLTSGDAAVEAWDPAAHLQLFRAYPVARGDISPDGRTLATASASGIALYPCDLCGDLHDLLATAGRETTRNLTSGERALYLNE